MSDRQQELRIELGKQGFSSESRADIDRVIESLIRSSEVKVCLRIYQSRRHWIIAHLGVSVALVTIVCIHVFSILMKLI